MYYFLLCFYYFRHIIHLKCKNLTTLKLQSDTYFLFKECTQLKKCTQLNIFTIFLLQIIIFLFSSLRSNAQISHYRRNSKHLRLNLENKLLLVCQNGHTVWLPDCVRGARSSGDRPSVSASRAFDSATWQAGASSDRGIHKTNQHARKVN